jgi:hypothetical protein
MGVWWFAQFVDENLSSKLLQIKDLSKKLDEAARTVLIFGCHATLWSCMLRPL